MSIYLQIKNNIIKIEAWPFRHIKFITLKKKKNITGIVVSTQTSNWRKNLIWLIYLIISVSIDQNRNGRKGNQIFENSHFLYQPSILVWNLCCLFRLLTIHFLRIPFNNKDQLDDEAPNPIEDTPSHLLCKKTWRQWSL